MAFTSSVRGILGGRRRGGRVKTSTKKKRGAHVKIKIKIAGSPKSVKRAMKTIATTDDDEGLQHVQGREGDDRV